MLEVIISLAIMAGAMAILGELARAGLRHAESARDIAEAEIICESKLSEITSGLAQPDLGQRHLADTRSATRAPTPPPTPTWVNGTIRSTCSPVNGQEGLLADQGHGQPGPVPGEQGQRPIHGRTDHGHADAMDDRSQLRGQPDQLLEQRLLRQWLIGQWERQPEQCQQFVTLSMRADHE